MKKRLIVDGLMLKREDDKPFPWLADTAWELFHRYSPDDASKYLKTRARQNFNVIQAVLLAEEDGLRTPNRLGHLPFSNLNTLEPEEDYWKHVDHIVAQANSMGLVMALLPTWGDKVTPMWGVGPKIFNPSNARTYGSWIGKRYREADVVWVIGGDRPVNTQEDLEVWRAMAEGIKESVGDAHLLTFHPSGGNSSATFVHDEKWLDFNMTQSGHCGRDFPVGEMIKRELELMPPKPVLDGESNYEDHPVMASHDDLYIRSGEYFGAFDVRKSFYRSILAGACGFTYGCHSVWQGWDPATFEPINAPLKPAMQSLELDGANQLKIGQSFLSNLLSAGGVNANDGILAGAGLPAHRKMASCLFKTGLAVYTPVRQNIILRHRGFGFQYEEKFARWMETASGMVLPAKAQETGISTIRFVPPHDGDWVLHIATSANAALD